MSTPDHLLPVFSFRPNWEDGVTEWLEWLTPLLVAKSSGAEQRIALRRTPRRGFEAQVEPLGADRTFFDLFLRRFGAAEFTLPLWHDRGALDASAASGATSLSFDTTDREFVSGGMALLMGANALDCEAVRLDAVSPGGATLLAPTVADWTSGATIHPLRRARFDDKPDPSNLTDRLASIGLTFELAQANDYDGGAEELATFGGIPILAPAPNWSDEIDLEYFREIEEIDNEVGLKAVVDLAGRSFNSQMHRWMIEGRADLAAFYRLLYRLRGKQSRIWLPSFTSDLVLAAGAAVGATFIDVVKCGLDYTDFPDAGRNKAINADGELLSFTTLAASPGTGIERLNLSTPLAGTLSEGDVLQWVDIGRLDSDRIELHHETDSDGITLIEAPFRSFADVRDGLAAGVLDIPLAEITVGSCGDPGDVSELVCGIEFVVDLPEPVPNTPLDFGSGNIYVRFRVDASEHGGSTSTSIEIDFHTDPDFPAYEGYDGVMHPTGIDAFHDVSWMDATGFGPTDAPLYRFKYDSTANTLTIQAFAPVLDATSLAEFEIYIQGLQSEVGGGGLAMTVTQALDFGTPSALALDWADAGSYDYGGGVMIQYLGRGFDTIAQAPCEGGPGGGGPGDPDDFECGTEPCRFPVVYTIDMPANPPTDEPWTVVGDDYAWFVKGRLRLKRRDCALGYISFYLGTIESNFGSGTLEPTLLFEQGFYDPVNNDTATVSISAERTGTTLTLTVDCTSEHITIYQAHEAEDQGEIGWEAAGFWLLTIAGRGGGWVTDSFTSSADITLTNPGESGPSPIMNHVWGEPHYPIWGDGFSYNFYFIPYLDDLTP